MTLPVAARIVNRRFRFWRRRYPTGWALAFGMYGQETLP